MPSVSDNKDVLRIPGVKTKNKQTLKVGTWNIRSLYESGKLANTIQEMNRLQIDILGVSETFWPASGSFRSEGAGIYYSGNNTTAHRRGVAIILVFDKLWVLARQ